MARVPNTNPDEENFDPESFMNDVLNSDEDEFGFDDDEDEDEDEFDEDEDDEEIQALTDFDDTTLVLDDDVPVVPEVSSAVEDVPIDLGDDVTDADEEQAFDDEDGDDDAVVDDDDSLVDSDDDVTDADEEQAFDDEEDDDVTDADEEQGFDDEDDSVTAVDEENNVSVVEDPVVNEPRENTATAFFESLDDNTKSTLINTFASAWRNMINDAGGEDFQEKLRELHMRHSIAMEQLELYGDGENSKKLELAQKDIEEIETEIANTTARSKAPEEMTLGMVRYALDLGMLFINESDLDGKADLFRPGIQFNGETFSDRIDVASTRRRTTSAVTGTRTRTVERKTKPCTEIIIYEQANKNSVSRTFNGREYGVRPLTNATILLADYNGSPFDGHGCSWDDDKEEYIMPRKEDCKNLPFTAGGDGEGKAQVHFLASLACSTQTRITGMHHGEVEFDMVPDGNGGLYILDVDGSPYRTGKIRTEAKTNRLNLLD